MGSHGDAAPPSAAWWRGAGTVLVGRGEALARVAWSAARRLTLAALFALAALWAFVWIAHELSEPDTRRFDTSVITFFQTHQTPPFHALMTGVSWLAGPYFQPFVVAAAVLGFALARRFFPDGLSLLVAGLGGAGLIVLLKHLFHRPRPSEIFSNLGYSFPSGHSFFAVVVYGMLAYWLARDLPPRRKRLTWTFAVLGILLVGFSRVFLGQHFPSDVAAGFAVGVPWLWGCLALPTAFHRAGRDLSPGQAAATVAPPNPAEAAMAVTSGPFRASDKGA
jgi:undecaprenyl-diphosphatase